MTTWPALQPHPTTPNRVPTATTPAVGTTTPTRDHHHAHTQPAQTPTPITSGNATHITNKAVAQHPAGGLDASSG